MPKSPNQTQYFSLGTWISLLPISLRLIIGLLLDISTNCLYTKLCNTPCEWIMLYINRKYVKNSHAKKTISLNSVQNNRTRAVASVRIYETHYGENKISNEKPFYFESFEAFSLWNATKLGRIKFHFYFTFIFFFCKEETKEHCQPN